MPHYLAYCDAFRKCLPFDPFVQFAGFFLSYVIVGVFWILYLLIIGFKNNVISRTRERLEDGRYWDLSIPRCYLYSEADALITWRDVREHALQARRKGSPMTLVQFKDSMHCAHIREDEDVYWDAVLETWLFRDIETGMVEGEGGEEEVGLALSV